ncbi:hypothetical protein Rhopal_005259-T1 [Rhodotorula paludigena]|uniref:Uncharacterized protein n=1 Tax=Rhodotorula paludigena TaxID=86838 RepID=A0AAV5GP29_9BASI|nr:hypothetical protein Rhopal_005259-T1 [Rhodotorula paludigena]
MTGSPSTLLARWPSANPQAAIPVLGRALTTSRPGLSTGRRAVQIRPLRLPASEAHGKEGRNMYVARALDGQSEKVEVFVENPAAPLRSAGQGRDRKGKGKAVEGEKDGDDDDLMIVEADETEQEEGGALGPSRWTHCSVGVPPGMAGMAPGGLYDTFIQRALFAPPQPGGQPPQRDQSYWQPRAQAVSIEGYSFIVGAQAGAQSAEWEVKVGSVGLKGGTASGTTKGCIIEVTYLPVPYLPANSTFVKDFLLSLFPPQAVRNGEIEILDLPEELFIGAGLLDPPDADKDEEEGEWAWRDKHTTFAYVHQFKKEGLL